MPSSLTKRVMRQPGYVPIMEVDKIPTGSEYESINQSGQCYGVSAAGGCIQSDTLSALGRLGFLLCAMMDTYLCCCRVG